MADKMLLFIVVNDSARMHDVMAGLTEAGVSGATLVESQGMASILAEEIPIFAGLRNIMAGSHPHNFTVFSVIENSAVVEDVKEILKDILEDKEEEQNNSKGILFTTPILQFHHL
ncbi:MAG: hypothetical protein ACE5FU_08350 [Nitrospinota bacterium]